MYSIRCIVMIVQGLKRSNMYTKQSQYEYDLQRTLTALRNGIKNVPETSAERIVQLLEYKEKELNNV